MNQIENSFAKYSKVGIDIEILEKNSDYWKIKISQSKVFNGLILNQKELVERVKGIFESENIKTKVIPVTYSIQRNSITVSWVEKQMEIYKIKPNDLIKQLALDKNEMNDFLNGKQVNKHIQISLFYYFLNHSSSRSERNN